MSKLNPRQSEAVSHTRSPLLVLAGAGSGKTSVITRKIAWLHKQHGIPAEHIFAVTFTNKAAREMKSRVAKLLDKDTAAQLKVSTFHSLGLNILRAELHRLGYRPGFSILDAEDSLNLMADLARQEGETDRSKCVDLQRRISHLKTELATPGATVADPYTRRLYESYEKHLKAYNAFDFDDLIVKPVQLLRDDDEARLIWSQKVRYLLVDEYQDTNRSQYELVRLLVGSGAHLTVVGDDDQSIYTWRGARPENLHDLKRDFPDLEVVKLEQNYRSTGRILKAANTLIANNPHLFEKRLWSDMGHGDVITILEADHEKHEAARIAGAIHQHHLMNQTRYRDYAILFRSNYQARELETALRELRIPYVLTGGTSFFDRSEVKDVLAYLRLVVNPQDDTAYLRIVNTPRRQIGPGTLEKLGGYATRRHSSLLPASLELGLGEFVSGKPQAALRRFGEWIMALHQRSEADPPLTLVKELLDELDYNHWLVESSRDAASAKRRQENIGELMEWLGRLAQSGHGQNLTELVNRIALLDMIDRNGEDAEHNQVTLMTLHAAKGLEFPHVYIAGMEEGILPHAASLDEDRLEEERRLAYVGITRARQTLSLCYARQRKRAGALIDCEPSRFLSELPAEDLVWKKRKQEKDKESRETGASYLATMRQMLEGGPHD